MVEGAVISLCLFLLDTRYIPYIGFEPRQQPSGLEIVNKFTKWIKAAVKEAKSTIQKAQKDMTRYYNQRRSLPLLPPIIIDGEKK